MAKKLKRRALSKFEAGRDVWQEVLEGVREINPAVANVLWSSLPRLLLLRV